MPDRPLSAVVLAAGEGTRMRSSRPKPLHRLCGRPMILHVLDALAELSAQKVVVVVGHRGEWVTKTLVDHAPPSLSIAFVEQPEQLGTGDAVAVGITGLAREPGRRRRGCGGAARRHPLVRAPTLASLVRHHRDTGAAATLLTAVPPDPTGHDRVVRGKDDAVVSWWKLSRRHRRSTMSHEVATTIHCFRHGGDGPRPAAAASRRGTGEHSLTGIYAVLHDAGYRVESLRTADPWRRPG
jgi:bifunctional UDP-N-acetylglucosamine pyrophosphorylase/glucosamine-1-phosphate N-acetyltransferase